MANAPINGFPQAWGEGNQGKFGHFTFQEDNFPTFGPKFQIQIQIPVPYESFS